MLPDICPNNTGNKNKIICKTLITSKLMFSTHDFSRTGRDHQMNIRNKLESRLCHHIRQYMSDMTRRSMLEAEKKKTR